MAHTLSETVDSLVASTLKKYKPGFVDQVVNDHILLRLLGGRDLAPMVFKSRPLKMGEMGPGIKMEDGGRKIHFSLKTKQNSTFAAYSGHDTLNITPQQPFDVAEYERSGYVRSSD